MEFSKIDPCLVADAASRMPLTLNWIAMGMSVLSANAKRFHEVRFQRLVEWFFDQDALPRGRIVQYYFSNGRPRLRNM
jgi:hypothetical protein